MDTGSKEFNFWVSFEGQGVFKSDFFKDKNNYRAMKMKEGTWK
jgi:hypothetical protein